VSALKMMPLLESVVIHLRQAMSADGTLVPTPAMLEAAKDMLDELQLMTSAFAAVRA